ncbi:MAG: class I SAM-dependent methyltransferase [Patescibacteria group bacterium]|jgi:ubiquinone/menaquinone biosynthesis C-methylase UbiE|nr:class I SAM-dependent methyltransferase [Patescibacteria group bacterium]
MTDKTIDTYNKFAKVYDEETKDFWDNFPGVVIDKFVGLIPGKKIVDLGSGPGQDALLLKARGLEVVCVDASNTMVAMTEKFGFKSVLSDFRDLNFNQNSFDGVWAYTSLLHLNRQEMMAVLKKINFFLKSKGVFMLGMIEGDFAGYVTRETMPGSSRYFHHYQGNYLQSMVEDEGFNFVYQNKYQPRQHIYLNQLYVKK